MTTDDRRALAADLLELRCQARETIPRMAEVYARCTQDLNDTGHHETGVFDASFGPNPSTSDEVARPGDVFAAWARLRDELQSIMAATVDSLNATARALDVIAGAYAGQDESLRRELDHISRDLPDHVPCHRPERPPR